MNQNGHIISILKQVRNKRLLRRVISLLSAFVILVTFNTLKLDADTLERRPTCGIEEHTHTDACFAADGHMRCMIPEHVHTDACYQQRPKSNADAVEQAVDELHIELGDGNHHAPVNAPVAVETPIGIEAPSEELDAFVLEDEEEVLYGDEEDALEAVALEAEYVLGDEPDKPQGLTGYVVGAQNPFYLSDVLKSQGLELSIDDVVEIGQAIAGDDDPILFTYENVDGDIALYVEQDFERAELVISAAEELHVVELLFGIAPIKSSTVENEEEETVSDDEKDEEPEASDEETTTEETTEEETTNEEAADEEATDETADEEQPHEAADVQSAAPIEAAHAADDEASQRHPLKAYALYVADIDLADVEAYPISLNELMDKAARVDEVELDPAVEPMEVFELDDAVEPKEVFELEEVIELEEVYEVEEGSEIEAPVAEAEFAVLEADETPADGETMLYIEDDAIDTFESDPIEPMLSEITVELGGDADEADEVPSNYNDENHDPDEWIIDYDETLLSIEKGEDGYALSVIGSFEETIVTVNNGDLYTLTLLNGDAMVMFPAASFTATTDSMVVNAEAPKGAFPVGTTMVVKDVDDEDTISNITDKVEEGFVRVKRVHAVDITFLNADGEAVEPLIPISVTMSAREPQEDTDAVIVHVDHDGAAQVLDETTQIVSEPETLESEGEAANMAYAFTTDAFSVYALVVGEKLETWVIAADGNTYRIELTYAEDAEIPADARLEVAELTEESYLSQAQSKLLGDRSVVMGRFFDIKIMSGEEEVQPAAPVMVRVELVSDEAADLTDATPCAIHFAEDALDVLNVTETDDDAITFRADGFSVWGVVYTVDFHWNVDGMAYEFSLYGGDSVNFRDMVAALRILDTEGAEDAEPEPADADTIDAFIENITAIEFSDPELLWAGQIERDMTAAEIAAENALQVEYSGELTEARIAKMQARAYAAEDWVLLSMKPFTTEESLTVTLKTGEALTIRVTDAQLKKTVITAAGEAYEITVTYGVDAEIPDDAALCVTELLPGDEGYADYYDGAFAAMVADAELRGAELPLLMDSRTFDIEIRAGEEKIEPAAPVQVSMRLVGMPQNELSVVHFAPDGAELIAVEPVAREAEADADGDEAAAELMFMTDSFSVYAVESSFNTTGLGGQSFALVRTSLAQSNNTYPELGRAISTTPYSSSILYGAPVQIDNYPTTTNVIGGAADLWTFVQQGNNTNGYKIHCNGNYLRNNNGLTTTTDVNSATTFWVEKSGSKIMLRTNNGYGDYINLVDDGWKLDMGFGLNSGNGDDAKLTLCKLSTNYDEHKAFKIASTEMRLPANSTDEPKVSFTQIQDTIHYKANETIVIYKKGANGKNYAIDGDGALAEVSDDGAAVYWRGNKSLEWELTLYIDSITLEPNGYYELKNKATGKYLNPGSGTSAPISDGTIGLTFYEKDAQGAYSSTIEAWPSNSMDWYGLKFVGDKNTVPTLQNAMVQFDSEGNLLDNSQQFSFAFVPTDETGTNVDIDVGDPDEVDTVDSDTLGIKIKMFNYEPGIWNDYGTNRDAYCSWQLTDPNSTDERNRLKAIQYILKHKNSTDLVENDYEETGATPNLLKPILIQDSNGNLMPAETAAGNGTALFEKLFTGTNGAYMTVDGSYKLKVTEIDDVNHLFIKSTYDKTGYFHYSSMENYAYLAPGTTDFKVYQQVASPHMIARNDEQYFYHGHFMPFNDIDMSKTYDGYLEGMVAGEDKRTTLDMTNPRVYERVYGIQPATTTETAWYDKADYFYGMSLEADFYQKVNGCQENGEPIKFHFAGDDDMWVFIDGILVLDIGGVHEALTGDIDFSTGLVKVNGVSKATVNNTEVPTDLKYFYIKAYQSTGRYASYQAAKDAVETDFQWRAVYNSETSETTYTFADLTSHHFNMYYMERGAAAANLDLEFNLAILRKNTFVVEKTVNGTNSQSAYDNIEFAFKAYKKVNDQDVVLTSAVYEGTNTSVTFDADGTFWLKPGEKAAFELPDTTVPYRVDELGFRTQPDGTEHSLSEGFTGTTVNGTDAPYDADGVATSGKENSHNRARTHFENTPRLEQLHFGKDFEGSVSSDADDLEFEFYVRLENKDGVMGPYVKGPYYITKMVNGKKHYFYYVGTTLTDNGTEKIVCSQSGNNGSIAGIKRGYTVTIERLLPGTEFFISEREDRNPQGYLYHHKEIRNAHTPGTLLLQHGTDENAHADGILQLNPATDAEVMLYNEYGFGELDFHKVDQNGAAVQGAVFQLFTDERCTYPLLVDGLTVKATSEADGLTIFKRASNNSTSIPIGEYYMKEITTPTGFAPNNKIYFVHIASLADLQDESFFAEHEDDIEFDLEDYYWDKRQTSIVNESLSVKLKKVDDNGQPLMGASFQVTSNNQDFGTNGTKSFTITSSDGIAVINGLLRGSYTITETAPAGYNSLGGTISFTVANDYTITDVNKPTDDVTYDPNTFTFTVPNTPTLGSLTVTKQWLDYYGNAATPGETSVGVTLKRKVDTPVGKKLKIVVKADVVLNSTTYPITLEEELTIENSSYHVSWNDGGQFQWSAHRLKTNSPTWDDRAVSVTDGISSHGNPSDNGLNYDAKWDITNLDKATQDPVVITFTYYQNPSPSYSSWDLYLNGKDAQGFYDTLSKSHIAAVPYGTAIAVGTGTPEPDPNWTDRTLTLNAGNNWTATETGLPAVTGSLGYHYYIEESTVPTRYAVSYSSNNTNGITAGVLTASNRKTTADIKFIKVDKDDHNTKLGGAVFTATKLDATQTGAVAATSPAFSVTSAATATTGETIGETTISGLAEGYYEIVENPTPANHISGGNIYIKVENGAVTLLTKDDTKMPTEWTTRANNSDLSINSTGVITVSNPNDKGAIKLRKIVTIDDIPALEHANASLADGDYVFTIKGVEGTDTATIEKVVEITFEDGAPMEYTIDSGNPSYPQHGVVIVNGLTPGRYTVTETSSGRPTFKSVLVNSGTAVTASPLVEVTVVAGDAQGEEAKVTYTNNFSYIVNISGTKTWYTDTELVHSVPTLKLTRQIEGGSPETLMAAAATPTQLDSAEGTATDVYLQPVWNGDSYTYSNLPEGDNNENHYTYTVTEVSFTTGADATLVTYTVGNDGTVTSDPANAPKFTYAVNGYDLTNAEVMDVPVTKAWANEVQAKIASVSYGLTRSINGTADADFNATHTVTAADAATQGNWNYTWTDQHKYGKVKTASAGDEAPISGDTYAEDQYAEGAFVYTAEETGFVYDNVTYRVEKQQNDSYKVYIVDAQDPTSEAETTLWTVSQSGNALTNTLAQAKIEFTKEWWETIDRMHEGWLSGATINVALKRELVYDSGVAADDTYSVTLQGLTNTSNFTTTAQDTDNKTVTAELVPVEVGQACKFKISGMSPTGEMTVGGETKTGTWKYLVSETSVSADGLPFKTTYYTNDGNPRLENTLDGGTIRNTKFYTASLPETGGTGTTLFFILGSTLTLLAAALLLIRRRA